MNISVFDAFSANRAIENLIEQDIKLSFNCGYQLYQLKKELDDIEQYTIERLHNVIDSEHLVNNEMTSDEQTIYLAVMNSNVEINDYDFIFNEIKNNEDLKASFGDIIAICNIFGEKNVSTSNEN